MAKENSLKKELHIFFGNSIISKGVLYNLLNSNNNLFFNFSYLSGTPPAIFNIKVLMYGDSLTNTVKNDSIVSYHLECNNFSLNYSDDTPIDIFVEGRKKYFGLNTERIPIDILFLKRNKMVYLLLMTPENANSYISPDLLPNIVMG